MAGEEKECVKEHKESSDVAADSMAADSMAAGSCGGDNVDAQRRASPVIIGCFDSNGKCSLSAWRRAHAKIKGKTVQELQVFRFNCQCGHHSCR